MSNENEPEKFWDALPALPVCNFCDKPYDPFDVHTCPGNQIIPRKGAKRVEDESVPEPTVYALRYVEPTAEELARLTNACANIPIDPDWRTPVPPSYPDFEGLPPPSPSALETQPGGDHYRKHAIQPVEYIVANGIGFLAGNVIKYATRYKDKGGAEDIRKIIHYAQLILEFEYKETSK